MNSYLSKLQAVMEARHAIGAEELRDALFRLRAHYNLAGIVVCCRRLVELVDRFAWLQVAPDIDGYPGFLRVVRAIGGLDDADPHFLTAKTSRNRKNETPLRPFSGDSALCDLLLIEPGRDASEAQRELFSWAQAWFAAQVFRFQVRVQPRSEYDAYLDQVERKTDMDRLVHGQGSRVYGAMRLLRMLGDPEQAELAQEVTGLLQGGLDRTPQLVELLGASLKKRSGIGAGLLAERSGVSQEEVQQQIRRVRELDRRFGRRPKDEDSADLRLLSRFLEAVWRRGRGASADRSARIKGRIRGEQRRLDVERYGEVEALPQRVEAGIAGGGILMDLWVRDDRPPRDDPEDDAPANQDADDGPTEPELQIFLGDGDPVGAYYASKSASHHIESENALLRWPRWRLSKGGLDCVLGLIDAPANGEPLTDWARLLIAVSLVTGRRLPVAHAELVAEANPAGDKLAITLVDKVLHLPAGRPELRGYDDSPDPLPEFCAPWASTLRLPLPRAWHPLVDRVAGTTRPRLSRIEREADHLLDSLPPELAVSEKAIAHALKLALLEAGRDDLGLVKVLTDAADANTQNLIHYASYPRGEVEALWHRIVRGWAGPLGDVELPVREGERVGSPFGMEVEKVARAVADLKADVRAAIQADDWTRAQTLLVLYLSLWLGLGTAGRGTRHPVPPLISDDGWALVQDKHRPDASTDRLVPLSEGLRRQIEVVRALTESFGIADPSFVVPEPGDMPGLPLRVFVDGQPAPFQPSHWRAVEAIRVLPRNWARRLVRSDSPDLLGRFKDAGLGHWVRGRHPWSWTSTFPAQAFARAWLAVQARLEAALGFEVIEVPELAGIKLRPPASPGWGAGNREAEPGPASRDSDLTDESIQALLASSGRNGEFEAVFETEPRVPEAARWLLAKAIVERRKSLMAERGRSVPLPVQDALAIAAYIRKETGIPIFAPTPRSRFQRNWLVASDAFSDWIRLEREVLPAIEKDLRSLPPEEGSHGLRIGRLIAAVAHRAGVLDTQHIDALFAALRKDTGIEAVGEARLVEILARTKRTTRPVRRTVFLDPFLSVLLMSERHILIRDGRTPRDRLDRHRSTEWGRHFQTYLRALGIEDAPTLPRFLSALRQKLMLESSPILAAYASGELFTVDLPISEFRRLAGFEVRPSSVPDELLEGDHWHDNAKDEEEALPADLQPGVINLARKFSTRQSPYLSEWLRVTRDDLKALKTPTQRLFGQFALHLIQAEIENRSADRNAKVRSLFKRDLRRNLTVVWSALAQFRDKADAINPLGAGTLRQLMDLTAEHFATRRHRAAWSRFRSFLQSADADEIAIPIELGTEPANEYVSAKILSREEMDRIESLLSSVQSSIGTVASRRAAQGHFQLTRDIGARRAETELLRLVDVDGDLMRIQEYEGRTLKTKASARVVPLQLLAAEIRARVEERGEEETVLDALAGADVSGANFYDRVSKAMKEVTRDPDIGLHHLRHTKASLMLLQMLDNVVPLDALAAELPWLASSLPLREDAEVLLGSAGQAGQGMKAISALLGHLHETTTLHHYVHSLCIAMHAHALSRQRILLPAAFRRRLPMGSSLYRYQQTLEAAGLTAQGVDYRLRDIIEARLEKASAEAMPGQPSPAVVRRSRPIAARSSPARGAPGPNDGVDRITYWEGLQRYLTDAEGSAPEGIGAIRVALREMTTIPSGKKGTWSARHPMPLAGFDGTPLPAPLLAGLPVKHAIGLAEWLIRLHRERREDFEWLMERWRHASNPVSGGMNLNRSGDYERAMALRSDEAVRIQITLIHQTKSRVRPDAKRRYEMTIKLGERAVVEPSVALEKRRGWRSAGAVRWVMTWATVAFDSPATHEGWSG